MKKLIFLITMIAIAAAMGCGGHEGDDDDGATTSPPPPTSPPPTPPYLAVDGPWSCVANEVENNCAPDGARGEFSTSFPINFQEYVNAEQEIVVCFTAPQGLCHTNDSDGNGYSVQFCSTLDPVTGNFSREDVHECFDGMVDYHSMFMGNDGVATSHHTTDTHLYIDYGADVCTNGAGHSQITLNCARQ